MLKTATGIGVGVAPPDACPHGHTLETCSDPWCKGRLEDLQLAERKSEAAFWQERKAHWISQGIDPIVAGELAWLNLAGRDAAVDAAVAKELDLEGAETLAQAVKSDGTLRDRLADLDDLNADALKLGQDPEWHPECGAPPWPLGTQWPAKTAYCRKCMKWWTGERAGHCTGCHQTLGSDTAFDQHRYGKHPRRCRSVEWMREHGWWQDDKGIWRLPRPETNPFQDKE